MAGTPYECNRGITCRDQLRAKAGKVELDAHRRHAHSADAVELGLLIVSD
jgi:hypothetical protein